MHGVSAILGNMTTTKTERGTEPFPFEDARLTGKYGIFRFDGKGFSSFTRKMKFTMPEDQTFMDAMDKAGMALAHELDGIVKGFVVSDEISIVLASNDAGEFPYGGRITKIATIGAGVCSSVLSRYFDTPAPIVFDGRGTAVDTEEQVDEYLRSRHRSGYINAVSMAASTHFSHKSLLGISTGQRLEMLADAGLDFNEITTLGFRNGRNLFRIPTEVEIPAAYAEFPGQTVTRMKMTIAPRQD